MKKSNVVTNYELIEFAVKNKFGNKYTNSQWNKIHNKVSVDSTALMECGSLDYDIDEVMEELEENPVNECTKNIYDFMKKHHVKKIKVIKD